MPLILPGNVATATASTTFDVANSVRMDGSSAYMTKTPGASSNRRTFTFSAWVKRSTLGSGVNVIFSASNSANRDFIYFEGDALKVHKYNSGYEYKITTNRLFRDVSAWYHIVAAFDTTQGTASNRIKLYVNGVQETSLADSDYPSEDFDTNYNTVSLPQTIGKDHDASNYFDGYIAEVVMIDGSALAPTSFGEFNSDSPTIWQPIDVSGLTFGTNGYYLDFEASANLGNDANGGTDLTEVNLAATDQSTDTCTNNFCTLNPLVVNSGLTFSEGNLNVVASNANYRHAVSTMAVQSGKWYAEFKAVSGFSGVDKNVGIYRTDNVYSATTGLGNYTSGTTWCYGATGNVRTSNGNNDTGEATFTDGDIIAVAMDLDNNKLYFAKNNAWINSGDPESGATGTGSYAIVAGDFYHFAVTSISSGGAALWSCNFGSPSYANSSDAADANGYGAFEYSPPSGYLALCTKNLGSDGG